MSKNVTAISMMIGLWAVLAVDCRAQNVVAQVVRTGPAPGYYAAPGYYGTAYGVASYRVPRGYSVFPSPSGGNSSLGYAPSSFVAGPYGAGLWRPGTTFRQGYGYSTYTTYTIAPGPGVVPPTFGYYAPGYGPGPAPFSR